MQRRDARAGGLGPETETSSVISTLPLDLIVDRSQPRKAPEEVRPGGEIDAAAAWAALEKARATLRAGVVVGDGLALGEVADPGAVDRGGGPAQRLGLAPGGAQQPAAGRAADLCCQAHVL